MGRSDADDSPRRIPAVPPAQYVVGLTVVVVCVGPLLSAAIAGRRRMLPGWSGPPAWVADAVLATGGIVVVSEVLGAVGQFRRWPVAAGCGVVGVGGLLAARRPTAGDAGKGSVPDHGRPAAVMALGAVATVAGQLSAWTAAAYSRGIIED